MRALSILLTSIVLILLSRPTYADPSIDSPLWKLLISQEQACNLLLTSRSGGIPLFIFKDKFYRAPDPKDIDRVKLGTPLNELQIITLGILGREFPLGLMLLEEVKVSDQNILVTSPGGESFKWVSISPREYRVQDPLHLWAEKNNLTVRYAFEVSPSRATSGVFQIILDFENDGGIKGIEKFVKEVVVNYTFDGEYRVSGDQLVISMNFNPANAYLLSRELSRFLGTILNLWDSGQ